MMHHLPTILIVGLGLPLVICVIVRAIREAPSCICNRPTCGGGCWSRIDEVSTTEVRWQITERGR